MLSCFCIFMMLNLFCSFHINHANLWSERLVLLQRIMSCSISEVVQEGGKGRAHGAYSRLFMTTSCQPAHSCECVCDQDIDDTVSSCPLSRRRFDHVGLQTVFVSLISSIRNISKSHVLLFYKERAFSFSYSQNISWNFKVKTITQIKMNRSGK